MYEKHMGKHTLMVYDNGIKLFIEGLSLEIVDDSSWKKRMKSDRKLETDIWNTALKRT